MKPRSCPRGAGVHDGSPCPACSPPSIPQSATNYAAFIERKSQAAGFAGLAEKPAFIYGLRDPRTEEIRYVGKSIRPQERLTNHMNEPPSSCHRSHWIQELKAMGLRPALVLLERVDGAWSWQESERRWIAYGRAQGWPLTNNTDGGDGVVNLPEAARAKMRLTWLGRKHKPETIAKLRFRRPGWRQPLEARARMSEIMSGRTIPWVDKIAAALRKLSPEQEDEIRRRLAAGELGRDLAREFGVHRTTLSKVKLGTYRGGSA